MTAPNIALLIFDDMTFEQLQRMPQFMRLALTGVNFLNAYASTAICQVARATFLTGQYSHNHGIIDNTVLASGLDHSTMLAARLQTAGYRTCHVGKYLNTQDINNIPTGWNDWHHTNPQQYFGYSLNDNGVITTPPDYHTTICNTRALSFINSTTEPFFLQIGYKVPHFDQPSVDFLNATPEAKYAGVVPTSRLSPRNPNFNVVMGTPPAYLNHAAMDTAKIAEIDAFWRGSTEALFTGDQSIAAVMAALASKPNTVVIATSDNGYFRGEGRDPAQKVVPYLPALQIPLIISGPSNLVAHGSVCPQLVCHIDIAATIYALTGVASTRTLDGISLAPFLLNPLAPAQRNYLMLEWRGTVAGGGTGWGDDVPHCRTLISKTYSYTFYDATGEKELYSLVRDPYQITNLVNIPAYAGVVSEFDNRLASLQSCTGSSCTVL